LELVCAQKKMSCEEGGVWQLSGRSQVPVLPQPGLANALKSRATGISGLSH
jgi:hypothetical protein